MNWLDVLFICLVLLGALYGAWKGLVLLVAMVVIAIGGIFAGGHLSEHVARVLDRIIGNAAVAGMLGFALVFIAVAVVLGLAAWAIRKAIRRLHLRSLDHTAGMLTGAFAGFLLCVAILIAAANASSERMLQPVRESSLSPVVATAANAVRVWVSARISDRLRAYLDEHVGEIKIPE